MGGPEPDIEFQEHVSRYFPGLLQSMVSLMQFISLDNMHSIYGPIVYKDPALLFFFVFVMTPLSLAITNLLGAIVVISLWEHFDTEKKDRMIQQEMRWTQVIGALHNIFTRLDVDGSGHLSLPEFLTMDPKDRDYLIEGMGVEDTEDMFDYLDEDASGQITIDEFCTGVLNRLTMDIEKDSP